MHTNALLITVKKWVEMTIFGLPELQNCTQNAIQVTKNGSFQPIFFTVYNNYYYNQFTQIYIIIFITVRNVKIIFRR